MKRVGLGMVALAATAFGQQVQPPVNLFQTVRPQVLLTIRRDPNGSRADLLEARTIDPKYPAEQLRSQILELGRQLNSEPRGLVVGRSSISGDESMTTIKASCAIDEIINRQGRGFHLTEISRAFVGYEEPNRVTGLSVQFVGETPTNTTLLEYGGPQKPVQLQAIFDETFRTIEYRIKLNTQVPAEIWIPDGHEQKAVEVPSTQADKGIDWTIWGLIAVAGIALGALVYSLLVGLASKKRSSG